MNDAFQSFVELVKITAPYSLAWGLGIKAYRFIVSAYTGRDAGVE